MTFPRTSLLVLAIGLATAVGAAVFTQIEGGSHSPQSLLESQHSVTLNWRATPGTSSYCIYRSRVSGSGYQLIGTSETATFKDTPVPAGAVFYYVVTSIQNGNESKYSEEIKAVVPK
jgi:fibronectin type 3 domain-containing protein